MKSLGSKLGETGGWILLHGEVDQSQVVEDLPLKWSKVDGPLQTANGLEGRREVGGGGGGG